ncbi:PE family protein [Mycobacterium haemophilum]|uniref:PE family protein n=1 Tax=Mycobacterium haemophilum TaxID=29311 RepID=UPI000A48C198|nr:PE family protein [Mycobacterium haemophilum]MCV7339700.1 PE family protein [Mycobacterium haemophilum DSM 44634]
MIDFSDDDDPKGLEDIPPQNVDPPLTNLDQSSTNLDPSLSMLNLSLLKDVEQIRANPDGMTEVSTKMVEIAHQISIANAKKAPVMTKIPAPGKDSVSALSARFFNARGKLYQVHTDRGADIGKRFSWSLKEAASKYIHTDEDNKKSLNLLEDD